MTKRRRSHPLLFSVVARGAALLALGAVGCAPREPPAPIVLVSIDTLRADRLPVYGHRAGSTPAIDALARDAVRFENAYAHYPLTLPSHLTMLTGLLPPRHGVRDNVGYVFDGAAHGTLQTLLADDGYATAGFVSSFVLRAETGVAKGFTTYDDPPPPKRGAPLDAAQRPGAATVDRAVAWLTERKRIAPGAPYFLFVHLYEPHAPYAPPEPWRSRFADAYDGEVAAADAAVGRLIEALRTAGDYERATIALVSDHGEGLGEHGEHQHGVFLYRSTLRVPLLLKLPRRARAGEVATAPVGLVDLLPTLARLAGARMPDGLDGRDLLAPVRDGGARSLYAETYYPRLHFGWSDLQAMIEPRWYLVRGPQPELFDVAADPAQTRNVLADERRESARLRAEIDKINRPLAAPAAVDEETARKLAALGYLSAGSAVAGADLPDPKTQRHLLKAIEDGLTAFWTGRFEESIAAFDVALAENPSMSDLWAYRARALDRLGRPAEALVAWERVLALSGGNASVALTVAERQLELGQLERAAELARSVESTDPGGALDLRIRLDLAAGDAVGAEAKMRDAVARGLASELVRRQLALAALVARRPAETLELLPDDGDLEPSSRILRSLALADSGRGEEGTAELELARRESEPASEFFENLGAALLKLGRVDKARVAYEQAVRMAPGSAAAWNSLGVARLQLDGPPGALDAWRRAVAADPTLADAWFNLGVVASQTGDRALARRAFRAFLDTSGPVAADQRRRAEQELARLGAG